MQTLELIITYKWVRGAVALLAGLALLLIIATGLDAPLRELANELSGAAAGFGTTLLWATDPQHLLVMGALLTLDGVVTFVEGFALWRRLWWGPWLVVIASSLLVPFEVAGIIAHSSLLRVGMLALNLAIVGWLLRARMLRGPELKVVHALKTGSDRSGAPASLP